MRWVGLEADSAEDCRLVLWMMFGLVGKGLLRFVMRWGIDMVEAVVSLGRCVVCAGGAGLCLGRW